MTMTIVDRGEMLTEQIREFTDRRLKFALSRFGPRIQKITVVFEDDNGPRGGIDKVCRIVVKLKNLSDVVVTGRDADLEKCAARTAERVGRAVARAAEKSRTFDRVRTSTTSDEQED